MNSKYIVLAILILGNIVDFSRAGSDHKRLLVDLLKGYELNERPVQYENETVQAKIGLLIFSLVNLNVAKGYLETNLQLMLEWDDFNLKWNSSYYGGIKYLSIPVTTIWRPDFHMYNNLHPNFDATHPMNAVVWENGTVMYHPPGIFRSRCFTDVTNYPFDDHNCSLKLGTWTHNGLQIRVSLNERFGEGVMITSYAQSHTEWELLGATGYINTMSYACCPEIYIDVNFVMHLKRRGDGIFAEANFVLIFGVMSTLLILYIPINSGQRVSFGIITFLALLIVGNSINNDVCGRHSILVCYFRTLVFLIYLSIVSNVVILAVYNRNPSIHNIPIWLRSWIFEKIPPFILLHRAVTDGSGNAFSSRSGVQGNYEELVTNLKRLIHIISGQETQSTNDWQYFAFVLNRISLLFTISSSVIFLTAFYCTFA